jgi:hypothetical protein
MTERTPGYPTTRAEIQDYRETERARRKAERQTADAILAAWTARFDALSPVERWALESRARVRLTRFLRDAPPEEHARMIRHQAIALFGGDR